MMWKDKLRVWQTADLPDELAAELCECTDETELEDRFYRNLEFGTGGLRGLLGAGTNRMNIFTVAKATRGLASYLNAEFGSPSCAIAYDSRIKSEDFAKVAAATLAQAGVKVYLYRELMPTPMLSFAVRHLSCSGGIVITASHNPAQYNGYKVYGEDGCQITLQAAQKILACIEKENDFELLPSFDAMCSNGNISFINDETTNAYYSAVLTASLHRPQVPLHVVYSPLNGTGNKPVQHILKEIGNVQVTVVPEQQNPDGRFLTCPYPNPEIQEAMKLAADLAMTTEADFFLATDPDCDRVGVGVPTAHGIRLINGNDMGVMLFDFICKLRKSTHTMPQKPIAVKTIVTTEMAAAVAAEYGVELRNVLTGFKFIGEQIGLLDKTGEAERFIFGFEESYGYLSGSFVRDKDAVNAAMLICEMGAYYKQQGKNLLEVLEDLYQKYGYYQSDLLTFTFNGPKGMSSMQKVLDGLRENHPSSFAGKGIVTMVDYLHDNTGLPKSNVIAMSLEDGCQVVIRPSGTEPKLKLYTTAVANSKERAKEAIIVLNSACKKMINP